MKIIVRLMILVLLTAVLLTGCNKEEPKPADTSWAMSTENYTVTYGQFAYIYNSIYASYQTYADSYGIDTDKPLDQQACTLSDGEGYTWHDYFVEETKDHFENILVLCEAAKARGIGLDEEEKQVVENNIGNLQTAAKNLGMSVEELVVKNYGEGVTVDDMRAYMQLQLLASKANDIIMNEPVYTDEDLANECENNPGAYYGADYRYYKFEASFGSDSKTSDIAAAKAEAKAKADALFAAAYNEESFVGWLENYFRDELSMTGEQVSDALDNTLVEGYSCSAAGDFAEWAFEKDDEGNNVRVAGDKWTQYNEENGTYVVCIMVRPMYREEYACRNVRQILISVDSYDSYYGLPDADAKAKAESILEQMKTDGVTEEEFIEAARAESMDYETAETGGLYMNVAKGQMKAAFDNWLFNVATSVGDTGIVKTEYGYHIVYYSGEGSIKWKYDAEYTLRNADYNAACAKLYEDYPITVNEPCFDVIKSI